MYMSTLAQAYFSLKDLCITSWLPKVLAHQILTDFGQLFAPTSLWKHFTSNSLSKVRFE